MTTGATPRVSLVIPVYEPGPYLRPCLDSILAQDLPEDEIEVIAVDDGSTDGSGAILDDHARDRRGWQVVHQENSGWPGRPRNVGLARARGTYVLFLDADDELGPEALRRLADFADEHSSDVVIPKMVGLGGREIVEDVYEQTVADADRVVVFGTLTPGKLFRRTFLEEHGLRFPEGRIRLEDGQLVARAYLTARRVSIYADYDCYFLRRREDGGNISYDLGEPSQYTAGIAGVLDVVREHGDGDLADAVALDLYWRKALKQLRPGRYFSREEARRTAWVQAVGELARTHVPEAVEARLRLRYRLRSRLARKGDQTALEALLLQQQEGNDPPVVVRERRVLLDLPHDGDAPLDMTGDVRLYAGLRGLHIAEGRVFVQGQVRLRGVRAERIPLFLVGGKAPLRAEQKLVAEPPEDDAWCAFAGSLELGEWADRRGAPLALRLRVNDGEDMWVRLARFAPPREEEPDPALRERLGRARRAWKK
jgi:glycosyltransferase involved in cell wall biosynthesis